MTERELLRDQWRLVAAALSIDFVAPFVVSLPDGTQREFAGLLPQFGGQRGMLVDVEYDKGAFAAVVGLGFACSTMRAEVHHLPVDAADYVDCLVDWGWSQLQPLPAWYPVASVQGSDV